MVYSLKEFAVLDLKEVSNNQMCEDCKYILHGREKYICRDCYFDRLGLIIETTNCTEGKY